MSPSQPELLDQLQQMDEYEFEELVADVWEAQGYETTVTSGSSDRGIDVIAEKDGLVDEKVLIQAKRYGEGNKVGSREIREYDSLRRQEENVDAVIVVTTSSFTREAENTADDLNVKLVDGESLISSMSSDERKNISEEYDLIGQSSADSSGQTESQEKVECPYCNTEVAKQKEAFLQHWKNPDQCRIEEKAQKTSLPDTGYPVGTVPCPYCGDNVSDHLPSFCSHWNNSCNLPPDISPEKLIEDAKEKFENRPQKVKDVLKNTEDAKNKNSTRKCKIEDLDISISEEDTHNLSAIYKNGGYRLCHPKIPSKIKIDEILDYFTNSRHGVGLNEKSNKITPSKGRKSVFINSRDNIFCIIGKKDLDVAFDISKSKIDTATYHSGFTKNRIELVLMSEKVVHRVTEKAEKVHIWVKEDKSDLDFLRGN